MMQLPNTLGFVFGIIQMVVYLIYRNATPVKAKELDMKIGYEQNDAGGGAVSKV